MKSDYSDTVTAVTALVAKDDADFTTVLGALSLVKQEMGDVARITAQLKLASELLEDWCGKELAKTGEKSRKIPGVGSVTRAVRSAFKITEPAAFYAELDAMRSKGATPADVYGWLGKSVNRDAATVYLEAQHRLPAGVEAQPTTYVVFTRAKE